MNPKAPKPLVGDEESPPLFLSCLVFRFQLPKLLICKVLDSKTRGFGQLLPTLLIVEGGTMRQRLGFVSLWAVYGVVHSNQK
jgi:hypothetical protein